MIQENLTLPNDAALLYQVAQKIQDGAFLSTLQVSKFLRQLTDQGVFIKGFDVFEAFAEFDFDGDLSDVTEL